jgi:hypothetical protein
MSKSSSVTERDRRRPLDVIGRGANTEDATPIIHQIVLTHMLFNYNLITLPGCSTISQY